jgi:uncharacterized protein with FMN-binding domain
MKRKGKSKLWILITVILVLALIFLTGGILCSRFSAIEREEAQNLPIGSINFKELKEGTYTGEYEGGRFKLRAAAVQVTVASGKVTEIRPLKGATDKDGLLTELNSEGQTIEDLFDRVIKAQSLQVEPISDAVIPSKAHLKAVEIALEKAQE